ncbi:MAG: glycosyltransferase family protein [Nitrospinae bacterium]|nr:glycosyltransferase family protein [Nitrospinota bacterium]
MSGTLHRVAAIIQARCGSTRLHNKIFEPIGPKPLLWWVVKRLKNTPLVDSVIIATSTLEPDAAVEAFAASEGLPCVRGSEDDVLDRYMAAIRAYPAQTVVRATGDNPLVDPATLNNMIKAHLASGADYTGLSGSAPLGSTAEVFSAEALERTWREAQTPQYREHVTAYMYTNPDKFRINRVPAANGVTGRRYRLTVDTAKDMELVKTIYAKLDEHGEPFDCVHAVKLLEAHPEMAAINAGVEQKDWRETK